MLGAEARECSVQTRANLDVLPFILELRWHVMDVVAGDLRMRFEELGEDGGAAAVQADDEDVPRKRRRRGRLRGHQDFDK